MPDLDLMDEISIPVDSNQAAILDWFWRDMSQTIATMGVRGAGKSAVIRPLIFQAAVTSTKQIVYASQSTQNSDDQFNKMIKNETVQKYLYSGTDQEAYTTKPVPEIRFANGSTIEFWSMEDFQSKRGKHPHFIVVDEAQSVSYASWSRILYPMRVRFGKFAKIAVFGSCPETDGQWFWKFHQDGLTYPNAQGVKSFTMSIDNSLAFKTADGQKFLSEAEATMSKADFESEFKMKPGGQGGCYLNHKDIDECVRLYNPDLVRRDRGTIMPFDPALGKQDPAAYCVMDLEGNVFKSHSIDQELSDTEQVDHLVSAAKEHKSLVVIESNSTPWMTYAGALKKLLPHGVRDVPFRAISTRSHEAKNVLYKQLRWMLEKRAIRINPDCKELIRQLKSLRDYKSPSGALEIKPPGQQHDDEASCLVIAAEALNKGWKPYLGVSQNLAMSLL